MHIAGDAAAGLVIEGFHGGSFVILIESARNVWTPNRLLKYPARPFIFTLSVALCERHLLTP